MKPVASYCNKFHGPRPAPTRSFQFMVDEVKLVDCVPDEYGLNGYDANAMCQDHLYQSVDLGENPDSLMSECTALLFGALEDGTSITVRATGFRPFFRVELGHGGVNVETIPAFTKELCRRLRTEDIETVVEYKQCARQYKYDPKKPNVPKNVPVLSVSFGTVNKCRHAQNILKPTAKFPLMLYGREVQPVICEGLGLVRMEQHFLVQNDLSLGKWIEVTAFSVATTYCSHDQVEIVTSIDHLRGLTLDECDTVVPKRVAIYDIEVINGTKEDAQRLREQGVDRFVNADRPSNEVVVIGLMLSEGPDKMEEVVFTTSEERFGVQAKTAGVLVEYFTDELTMLMALRDLLVVKFNADIISGWNSDNFDMRYLMARLVHLLGMEGAKKSRFTFTGRLITDNANLGTRCDNSRDSIPVAERCENYCRCDRYTCASKHQKESFYLAFPQRLVLDLMLYAKNVLSKSNGDFKLANWKIDNVCRTLLGEGKDPIAGRDITPYWWEGGERRWQLIQYCVQDVALVLKLFQRYFMDIDLLETVRTFNTAATQVVRGGEGIKAINLALGRYKMLNAFHDESFVHPTFEGYIGGHVADPVPGVYKKPFPYLDFKSLYPTSMLEPDCNFCASRYVATFLPGEDYTPPKGMQVGYAPIFTDDESRTLLRTHVFATATRGLMQQDLAYLGQKRAEAKALKKAAAKAGDKMKVNIYDARQLGFKRGANSKYGANGDVRGKFYCKAVAESTPGRGRVIWYLARDYVLKNFRTAEDVERLVPSTLTAPEDESLWATDDMEDTFIVYGDTDSIMPMVALHRKWRGDPDLYLKRIFEVGEKISEMVNEDLLTGTGHDLELEKVVVSGAYIKRKNYSMLYMETLKHPVKREDKGMPTVKRDRARVGADPYRLCLDAIHKYTNIAEIGSHCKRILKTQLQKIVDNTLPLSDYVAMVGMRTRTSKIKSAQVRVAEKIEKRSGEVLMLGDFIPVVYLDNKTGRKVNKTDRAEDPAYVVEHKLDIDRYGYVQDTMRGILTSLLRHVIDINELDAIFDEALRKLNLQRMRVNSLDSFFKPMSTTTKQLPSVLNITTTNPSPARAPTNQPSIAQQKKDRRKKRKTSVQSKSLSMFFQKAPKQLAITPPPPPNRQDTQQQQQQPPSSAKKRKIAQSAAADVVSSRPKKMMRMDTPKTQPAGSHRQNTQQVNPYRKQTLSTKQQPSARSQDKRAGTRVKKFNAFFQ